MFLDPSDVVNTCTTKAQAQEIIDALNENVSDLAFKILDNQRKSTRAVEISSTVEAQLQSSQATLTSYNAIVAGLAADSPVLPTFQDEVTKLQYKIFTLSKRLESVGKQALIRYSIENDNMQTLKAKYEDVRSGATTKRDALPA